MRGKADVSDLVVEGVEFQGKGQESVVVKTMKKENDVVRV